MAKENEKISGKKISPGIIMVDLSKRKELIQGQKVLIYKPIDASIVSPSGKIIGKKERVLGTGNVAIMGNKVVVKTSHTVRRNLASNKEGKVKSYNKVLKVSNQKLNYSRLKMDTNVFIKPIEE